MANRGNGTVKFFNDQRGFGFIALDDGQEIYFSRSSLPRARKFDPTEGDRVSCEIRDARKGPIAHRIEIAE